MRLDNRACSHANHCSGLTFSCDTEKPRNRGQSQQRENRVPACTETLDYGTKPPIGPQKLWLSFRIQLNPLLCATHATIWLSCISQDS